MSEVTYEALVKLPLVRECEEAFRKATGVPVRLLPAGVPENRSSLGPKENPFCALLSQTSGGALACWRVEAAARRRACEERSPQTLRCFAGLHLLAVPVAVNGRLVATWVCGQVFCRKPGPDDFAPVTRRLAKLGIEIERRQAKKAYFRGSVVSAEQWQAMQRLLILLSEHLAERAGSALSANQQDGPPAVRQAKEFVKDHLLEHLTLRQVSAAVRLSPFHFCRFFKKATGMTLTEHISRLRVERARALLVDPYARITDVAFAAGFGSLPQFDAVFRKYTGMSPTHYRASLKQRFQI